jgi:hypothetical protein
MFSASIQASPERCGDHAGHALIYVKSVPGAEAPADRFRRRLICINVFSGSAI